jgi:hypothetical protein
VSRGWFGVDLFLRYGSQDRFTPFSRIAAPAVAAFGVDWTFFVLFLIFNALLVLALQRVSMALVDNRRIAVASLLTLVFAPLPYGGLGIFHVIEFFFTPRLISCALSLFALERVVRERYTWAFVLGAAATIIHPLMGFGALAIAVSCAALGPLPRRVVATAIVAAAAVGIGILAYRPLAISVFGTMDPEWLEVTRQASAYNFPSFWTGRDWLNVALSIGIPLSAAVALSGETPHRTRFLFVCAALGVVGVLTMFVAGVAPYRLLLQGQPYRILWILAAIQIPIAFRLAAHLWSRGVIGRVASILLIASPQLAGIAVVDVVLSFIAIGFVLLILNRPASTAAFDDTLAPSLAAGLGLAFVASTCFRFRAIGIRTATVVSLFGMKTYLDALSNAPGPIVWSAALLCILGLVIATRISRQGLAAAAVLAAIAAHSIAFMLPRLARFRDSEIPYGRDLAFIKTYFAQHHRDSAAPPTVYDGIWESANLVWFDLRAASYFNLVQLSGVLFNRDTAIEGRRRALIVRPFELERLKVIAEFMPWADTLMITSLLGPAERAVPPTRADLINLCGRNEPIDVAILKHDFDHLASATNGRVFLYECAHVRAAGAE